ncbi:hypothetical protein I547_2037 [Mycobacterium kansasii 824]|nr:hypothetical protein I547_2037 [Mycobacterium kansasii 824]
MTAGRRHRRRDGRTRRPGGSAALIGDGGNGGNAGAGPTPGSPGGGGTGGLLVGADGLNGLP